MYVINFFIVLLICQWATLPHNNQFNILFDGSSYTTGVDFWFSVSSWSVGGPRGHQ
jgi:hypothetical protein